MTQTSFLVFFLVVVVIPPPLFFFVCLLILSLKSVYILRRMSLGIFLTILFVLLRAKFLSISCHLLFFFFLISLIRLDSFSYLCCVRTKIFFCFFFKQ